MRIKILRRNDENLLGPGCHFPSLPSFPIRGLSASLNQCCPGSQGWLTPGNCYHIYFLILIFEHYKTQLYTQTWSFKRFVHSTNLQWCCLALRFSNNSGTRIFGPFSPLAYSLHIFLQNDHVSLCPNGIFFSKIFMYPSFPNGISPPIWKKWRERFAL